MIATFALVVLLLRYSFLDAAATQPAAARPRQQYRVSYTLMRFKSILHPCLAGAVL